MTSPKMENIPTNDHCGLKSEFKECAGTRIYLLKKYISEEQCHDFMQRIDTVGRPQGVFHAPVIAQQLWQCIGPKISSELFYDSDRKKSFRVTGISNTITITNSDVPTPRHKDMTVGAADTYKLAFFLNAMSSGVGGTLFHDNGGPVVVAENEAGSGIMFDLRLEHEGQPFPKSAGRKYMIGARPHITYLP